jgi:hypothetical protein
MVSLVPKESGPIIVWADKAGFDRKTIISEVTPGIDVVAMLLLLLFAAGGVTALFYWRNRPPVGLKKTASGQEVTLRVKNRTDGYMNNVMILDSVPRGAFISCGLVPRFEEMGNVTNLTWVATLSEGEEITVKYQALKATGDFFVRIGDDEYHSGSAMASLRSIFSGGSNDKADEEYSY